MSSEESFGDTDETQLAHSFLDTVFPDAASIELAELPPDTLDHLHQAGFGMARVLFRDGTCYLATFITHDTGYTKAIDRIWRDELFGRLPPGSHDNAMDSIVSGDFLNQWSAFLPRQNT